MKVLVFKTDIKTKQKVKKLQPLFNRIPIVKDWSVDTEDIDKVLRIVTNDELREEDVIELVRTRGFQCEALDY